MTPRNQLLVAIAIACALLLGTGFAIRHELLGALHAEASRAREAHETLEKKLATLTTRIDQLEAAPTPTIDTGVIESLKSDLQSVKGALETQATSIAELKKVPAPHTAPVPSTPAPTKPSVSNAPLVAAVMSGAPYKAELAAWDKDHPGKAEALTAIRRNAASGIGTDTALRDQFRDILNAMEAQQQSNTPKLVERINTHLSGLVAIKKASDTAVDYSSLRSLDAAASLETMAARVDALPTAAQSPFLLWREAVRNRSAALAELPALTAGDAQ